MLVVDGTTALVDGTDLVLVGPDEAPPGDRLYLGRLDDQPFFAVAGPLPRRLGARPMGLRDVGSELGDRDAGLLVHAVGLANWHAAHPRCSRCGAPTRSAKGGSLRVCEADGSSHFPRTDPAVIVLITDGADRAVLGRQAVWPPRRYSTLAGFVEPGESAEQAVVREVAEEAGIAVREVVYRGSQPWPFPASLMIGYRAVCDPDAEPVPQDGELEDARWFTREAAARRRRLGRRRGARAAAPAGVHRPPAHHRLGRRGLTPCPSGIRLGAAAGLPPSPLGQVPIMGVGEQAADTARDAHRSDAVERLARLGLAARGVVWFVVGLLALSVLSRRRRADRPGRRAPAIADQPLGEVLLVVLVVGFAGYAAWQGLSAAVGHRDEDGAKRTGKRLVSAGHALLYAFLAVSTVRFLLTHRSGGDPTRSTTAEVLSHAGGRFLVGAVGLAVIAVGRGPRRPGAAAQARQEARALPDAGPRAPPGGPRRHRGPARARAGRRAHRRLPAQGRRRGRRRRGARPRRRAAGAGRPAVRHRAARGGRRGLLAYGLWSCVEAAYRRL